MSAHDNPIHKPRTYGNWIEPRTPGIIPGLGLLGSALVFAGIFLALPFMMLNLYVPAITIFLLTCAFAYLISRKDVHGKSIATKIIVKCGWWMATWKREHMFRGGILGYGPEGSMILPGLLARTQLLHATSANGDFGVIYCPRQHTYTLVIRTSPNGEDLVDPGQMDRWVAEWAQSKADMADEQGLLQYTVTVETSPANPLQLRQEVTGHADVNEPDFAASVMTSIVDTYPQGSSQANAYVAYTYSDRRAGGRRRGKDVMLTELSSRLPYLIHKLQATGAGACTPMSPAELCRYVRIAYDPEQAQQFDLADMQGIDVDLAWRNCGPMATQASWDSYRHDSGISETWEMTMPPRAWSRPPSSNASWQHSRTSCANASPGYSDPSRRRGSRTSWTVTSTRPTTRSTAPRRRRRATGVAPGPSTRPPRRNPAEPAWRTSHAWSPSP